MAKPAMVIDFLTGPGDDEDEGPGEGEDVPIDDETARKPARDPDALFASIESQLAELRRAYKERG